VLKFSYKSETGALWSFRMTTFKK